MPSNTFPDIRIFPAKIAGLLVDINAVRDIAACDTKAPGDERRLYTHLIHKSLDFIAYFVYVCWHDLLGSGVINYIFY